MDKMTQAAKLLREISDDIDCYGDKINHCKNCRFFARFYNDDYESFDADCILEKVISELENSVNCDSSWQRG